MVSYSSRQFFQDWRYAIKQHFTTSNGEAFPYAEDGHRQWGDESKILTFEKKPVEGCASTDGKRLALAVGSIIHVIDTATLKTVKILRGHISEIGGMAFKPGTANILVSAEPQSRGDESGATGPTILIWKIDEAKSPPALEDETLNRINKDIVSKAAENLSKIGVSLEEDALEDLGKAFRPAIARVVTKTLQEDQVVIRGRLNTNFGSPIFSPSGKFMAYLPGTSPRSNDEDDWRVTICSTEDFKDLLTLEGHTDSIMWTGWNHDESRFASVAWDGSIRIWDASTGKQTHQFNTDHQNWTGEFSPDSQFFAATDGNGIVHIYSLEGDGSTHWDFEDKDKGSRWKRTLSWHPNGKWLAVGGETCGDIRLLDIERKEVLQLRMLSAEASLTDEEHKKFMLSFSPVCQTKFIDGGDKLAVWAYGDGSIEVYDIIKEVKWRFARGGTEDGPHAGKWRDENGKVTSKPGSGMINWEDPASGKLILASMDTDGLRIWNIESS